MTERLQKRDDKRKLNIENKKEDREAPIREKCEHFHDNLSKEIDEIERDVSRSSSLTKTELIDHFDGLTVRLQKAQKFLSEATLFLPSYDISKATESLSKLQNMLQDKRNELMPKKKFAFKSKKASEGDGKKTKNLSTKDDAHKKSTKNEPCILADCKFVDEDGKNLSMDPSQINQKDVALARLKHCVVKLYGSPSAIHVNELEDCKIFCGPVSGSIFIRECKNCVFILSCQQLRIHTTEFTNFYIHVTSKAIIEDSHDVQFAPYNWNYPGIAEHFKLSGLDKERNNWDDIDDFNWLAVDAHSPNWSLVAPEQRKNWDP
ncbi:hypothetical protein LOTGIDRAFT_179417 [Lottia gigantea]|uniref:C-CAP/cofactor C-like domain-containing protein n=1 Tax=Lottia gigantea TaxID=225164 RepID=V3ZYS5_LOTGI|nr:hypothetical protein LOTGIDRAFT_179417 [Lottia gigantea]ESO86141.1 hypothetical protein LOTGIDRAFT_179417 [Lottia gigantea]